MYIALSEKRLVSLPFKPKSPKHSGTDDCWKSTQPPEKLLQVHPACTIT